MNKKFGFTLAEVLITLGIIGVVAALTAPSLVKNSGQAKIGPSLAKFVNTFETACEQLMHDEEINSLAVYPEVTYSTSLLQALSKYMIMTQIDGTKAKEYRLKYKNGTKTMSISKSDSGGYPLYQLKDGSVIGFTTTGTSIVNDYNVSGAYKGKISGLLFIDINGLNGSNIIGKEVFGFYVDKTGILIPFGSNTFANHIGKSASDLKCDVNSDDSDYAFICTGKIADNGWKADY